MTIKKKALGKITKIETEKPKKRKKKEDELDLLKKINSSDNISEWDAYTEEDDIDMVVE